jgi:hypothetical protein
MITLQELTSMAPLPDTMTLVFGIVSTIFVWLGTLTNCILLLTNLGKQETTSSILILNLCLSDIIFCIHSSITIPTTLLKGGYDFGILGCIVDFITLYVTSFISILTITSIAFERYLSVLQGIRLSQQSSYIWVAVIWIIALFGVLAPTLTVYQKDLIVLDADGLFCSLNWSSTIPFIRSLSAILLAFILSCYLIIIFSYSMVVKRVYLVSSTTKRRGVATTLQRTVIRMCLVLTFSFFIFWSPELIHITQAVITLRPSSVLFSAISGLFLKINAAGNPVLLFWLDPKVRGNVMDGVERIRTWFVRDRDPLKDEKTSTEALKDTSQASLPSTLIIEKSLRS